MKIGNKVQVLVSERWADLGVISDVSHGSTRIKRVLGKKWAIPPRCVMRVELLESRTNFTKRAALDRRVLKCRVHLNDGQTLELEAVAHGFDHEYLPVERASVLLTQVSEGVTLR